MAVTKTERAAIERQTLAHLLSLLDTHAIAVVFTQVIEHFDPTWTTPQADIHELIRKAGEEQANATAQDFGDAVRRVYSDVREEQARAAATLHQMALMARGQQIDEMIAGHAKDLDALKSEVHAAVVAMSVDPNGVEA